MRRLFSHPTWNYLAVACFLVGSLGASQVLADEVDKKSGDTKPNIVIILADDMGYGDVRAYNAESKIPTPNLDGLAKSGMRFTDGHSPSGVCTPTRYGLVTGRYCWRSRLKRGVLGGYSKPLIEKDRPTIATVLKSAGYQTAAVGKWHLGMDLPTLKKDANVKAWAGDPGIDFKGVIADSPIHHGFDTYFGVSASLDMAPYVYIRNDRFTKTPTLQQKAISFPHFIRKGPRADDFIVDEALDRLTKEAVSTILDRSKSDKPYFLYFPLTAPHKPCQPHKRFQGKTGLNEYGDFVHQVDWTVGEVLKAIEKSGEADNTIVIFTSDNGSYMHRYPEDRKDDHVTNAKAHGFKASNHRANGPLRGTKADVYEAGHRVPFLIRWPGKTKKGSVCNQTVCQVDFLRTCAKIAGAKIPEGAAVDSCDISGMLTGKEQARKMKVINHSSAGMFAIRDGKWKLVAGNGSGGRLKPKGKPFGKPYQLFNLESDIGETKNIANEHPEIVEKLTKALDEIRKLEN